jgi:hypothetical protein
MALAVAPGDPRLYSNLALSLDLQGRAGEAASVRSEMRERGSDRVSAIELATARSSEVKQSAGPAVLSATVRANASPSPEPMAKSEVAVSSTGFPGSAVNVPLTAPAPVPAPSVTVALPSPTAVAARLGSTRLERLSLGEVALVTSGQLTWKPRLAERTQTKRLPSASLTRSSAGTAITLLNAARSEGLAARAKVMLQRGGVHRVAIGSARRAQRSSVISYPSSRRAEAVRIASRFGFALRHHHGAGDRIVVVLGRDAAAALRRFPG